MVYWLHPRGTDQSDFLEGVSPVSSDRSGQVWAYDVDAVRELLEAAFDEASLRAFCLDRPAFRPVTYLFAPGDDLSTLAGKVTGYCLRSSKGPAPHS